MSLKKCSGYWAQEWLLAPRMTIHPELLPFLKRVHSSVMPNYEQHYTCLPFLIAVQEMCARIGADPGGDYESISISWIRRYSFRRS